MKKITKPLAFVSKGLSQTKQHLVCILKKRGYKFVRMDINRYVPESAVNTMVKSILSARTVHQPILVVAAQAVVDEGIAIYSEDGAIIDPTTTNLDKYLCILDGQTRMAGYSIICANKDIDSSDITCTCAFPQADKINITEILSTINSSSRLWCGIDRLQSLVTAWKDEPSLDLSKVRFICQLVNSGASETAAFYWGNFTKARAISKARYRSAAKVEGTNFEKHKTAMAKIAELGDYELGRNLYDTLRNVFLAEHLGVYCIPAFFIDKMATLQNDGMSKAEAYKEIVNFAKSFNVDMCKRVTDALSAGARKKDAETRAVLEDLYIKFKGTKK